MFRIINTDNFGSDYPDEKFVENLPRMTKEHAHKVAEAINDAMPVDHPRYWRVVDEDYKLQPGFEP